MSDAIHLKLDRILARQDEQAAQMAEIDEALRAVLAGLHEIPSTIGSLNETIARLQETVDGESSDGGELSELIKRVEAQLGTQNEVLQSIRATLLRLPGEVEAAAIDGIRLASGEAVDPRGANGSH